MKLRLTFILFLLVLCYSCKDETELPTHQLYHLVTDHPAIDNDGVTFTATLKLTGAATITERGFVVTRNYSRGDGYWFDPITETHAIGLDEDFRLRLEGDWDTNAQSTVYAYMKTATYNYQGETVEFTPKGSSAPKIYSVTPESGERYGTMIIKGKNFSQHLYRNEVYLGGNKCYIQKATSTELTVNFSVNQIGYHDLVVSVGGVETKLQNAFYLDGPRILSVSPDDIYTGREVTITVENFNKEMDIYVSIGEKSAYIFEKEDNYIKVLCPTIEDGKNTFLHIYFQKEQIVTPNIHINVPKNWTSTGTSTTSPGIRYIISENEGYGFTYESELLKFNKNRTQWEVLSYFNNDIHPYAIFGKGDYVYIAGPERDNELVNSLLIYHIPTNTWKKSPTSLPIRLPSSNIGTWIDNEYYISAGSYTVYAHTLFKYSPQTDTWTVLNDNLEYFPKLLTAGNKIYALISYHVSIQIGLYEFDLAQQKLGELIYTFPSYCSDIYLYGLMQGNDHIYFDIGHHDPMYLFSFDLINKELKSLGSPMTYFYGFKFILPFQEGIYAGCNYYQVYKYIGK